MRYTPYEFRDPDHFRSNRALREKLLEAQRHIQELESFSRILRARDLIVSMETRGVNVEARGAFFTQIKSDDLGSYPAIHFAAQDIRVQQIPFDPRSNLLF